MRFDLMDTHYHANTPLFTIPTLFVSLAPRMGFVRQLQNRSTSIGDEDNDDDDGGAVDEEVVGDVYLAQNPSESFVLKYEILLSK